MELRELIHQLQLLETSLTVAGQNDTRVCYEKVPIRYLSLSEEKGLNKLEIILHG